MEEINTECTASLKRKLSIEDETYEENSPENSETCVTDTMETDEKNQFEMITSNGDNTENSNDENHMQFDVLDEVQGDDSGSENGNNDQNGNRA